MDWKKYNDKDFLKKFNGCQDEMILKWETAEKEIVRLKRDVNSLTEGAKRSEVRENLLAEKLDTSQKKLFIAEKDLELTKKSLTPLDVEECGMIEVYMEKEKVIKEEQMKRVEKVLHTAFEIGCHFRDRMNDLVDDIPDYIRCCELCDGWYNSEEMRNNFRQKFASPDAASMDNYYLDRNMTNFGGVDMVYFENYSDDTDDGGGYYRMIETLENNGHKVIGCPHCLYNPEKDMMALCEANEYKIHNSILRDYKWMKKNMPACSLSTAANASDWCEDCLWEHYASVKHRDANRWKNHIKKHPSQYARLLNLDKIRGVDVLDIWQDPDNEPKL